MVSRWCRDGGMACIAGDFCFVCKAGMGVGIAASFRIFVGCRDVAAGLEFECFPGKRTTGRHELSFACFKPDGFNAGHLCRILHQRFAVFSIFVALGRLAYVPHQRLVRIASAFVGELRFPPLGVAFACQYLYLYFSEWFLGTGVVLVGLLDWADVFDTTVLWKTAFPVFFLIAWAEAFLSGISTAIFIALKPQWICTFDDGRYLKSAPKIWQ